MLRLEFWEDLDRKKDGRPYHCCGVDNSEIDGTLDTWYREESYEIAKEKMLNNLKRLRSDIDELIKSEEVKSMSNNLDKVKDRERTLQQAISCVRTKYRLAEFNCIEDIISLMSDLYCLSDEEIKCVRKEIGLN